jgi:hypothetical protein
LSVLSKNCANIGRPDWANFRPLVDGSLLSFFENYRSRPSFRATFLQGYVYELILTKMGWDIF